ncbi:RNA recognition motif domain-containing protein [Spirochaeta isovalerica]|uniref:RNA recognition motif-containing protein n=1 Tax=Spirochaeta isovalerica TaxID=150 RepID=A0A841RJV6_9SPIO|nr:RNA-binding protein [Spirochaeta isovalerica]MBB6482572.1 RNA recognition motif-containing protein [Spirochaeta isovalerica]
MGKKLYVGNINYRTSAEALESVFSEFGTVESISMVSDKYTGKFRGFSFVKMASEVEAKTAMENIDSQELDGRQLRVSMAIEKGPKKNREGQNL